MSAGATASAAFDGECGPGEPLDGLAVQLERACAAHGGDERVGDRGDDEDLLFADAEQVVVESAALDDAFGGVVEIGGFVDDDGRIAGPAGDDALAGFGGSFDTAAPPVTQSKATLG